MQTAGSTISTYGPRRVVASNLMVWSRRGIPFVYAIIAGILWMVTADQVSTLDTLRTKGVVVLAKVTNKRETKGKSATRYLGFQYADTGAEDDVGRDLYDNNFEGDQIEVTYLPSASETHVIGRVDLDRIDHLRGKWQIAQIVLAIVGSVCFGVTLATFEAQRKLLRDGVVAQATVEDIEAVKNGKYTSRRVHFSFKTDEEITRYMHLDIGENDNYARRAGEVVDYVYPERSPVAGKFIPQLSLVRLAGPNEALVN